MKPFIRAALLTFATLVPLWGLTYIAVEASRAERVRYCRMQTHAHTHTYTREEVEMGTHFEPSHDTTFTAKP